MTRWWGKRRRITVDAMERAKQEALLRAAIRQTPAIEKWAKVLAVQVSPDEMSIRLRKAMTIAPPDPSGREKPT